MKTIDFGGPSFQPLEDAIHHQFIPVVTGQTPSTPEVRQLLSLPSRLGGLNIVNPVELAEWQIRASKAITTPLKKMTVDQSWSSSSLSYSRSNQTFNRRRAN